MRARHKDLCNFFEKWKNVAKEKGCRAKEPGATFKSAGAIAEMVTNR